MKVAYSAVIGGLGDTIHSYAVWTKMGSIADDEVLFITAEPEETRMELPGNVVRITSTIKRGGRFRYALSRVRFEFHNFRSIMRHKELDAVYARYRTFDVSTVLACKLRRVPMALEINGFPSQEVQNRITLKLAIAMNRVFEKFLFRRAIKINMIDEIQVAEFKRMYPNADHSKLIVIPNGYDPDIFHPRDRVECRKELNITSERPLLLFVGALEAWQGLPNLVEAMKEIDADLLIVGDGSLEDELKGQVGEAGLEDRITFVGRVPFEQVPVYINASDVCLVTLPKERTAFTMKIREYLACGRPVVATRNPMTERLADDGTVVAIEDNEPAMIVEAVNGLISDDARMKEVSEKGIAFTATTNSWEDSAREIWELLEEIVKER